MFKVIIILLCLLTAINKVEAQNDLQLLTINRVETNEKCNYTKNTIFLSVTSLKQYFIDSKNISKSKLKTELSRISKTLTEPTIILKVDKTLPVQDLVELLDMGNELKIKMVLATQTVQQ